MKKFLTNIIAVIGILSILFTASCSRVENPDLQGMESEVTFSVTTPDLLTRANNGDGTQATDLTVAVFDQNNAPLFTETATMENKSATVTLSLVNGMEYNIVFWAQSDCQAYSFDTNDGSLSIDYSEATANNEKMDAFWAVKNYTVQGAKSETVTLTRPFAQLNIAAKDGDKAAASGVVVTKTSVTVKQVFSQMNLLSGEVYNPQDVTFTEDFTPASAQQTLEGYENYQWLSMNYLLVNEKALVDIELTTDCSNVSPKTFTYIPVQRNYRTNIHGNILTSETDFDVNIDDEFAGEENIPYYAEGTKDKPAKLEDIMSEINNEKVKNAVIYVPEGSYVTWETGAAHGSNPFIDENNEITETLTIQGEGENSVFVATGSGVGPIRAANGSKVIFKNITIVDESESYAENSWEFGYLEFGGNVEFENVNFKGAITYDGEASANTKAEEAEGTYAKFVNCSFISLKESEYDVWVSGGDNIEFENCKFNGFRGLKMHEAYGSEIKSVKVEASTFGPLSKKPGIAIGTINADTKVTINKCYFINCQPGDQGLYMYETDTDVTTFSFTETNNTVLNNSVDVETQESLADAIANAQEGDVITVSKDINALPAIDKKITLFCEEGTVFESVKSFNLNGSTVIGASFKNEEGTVVASGINGIFKDCNFEGNNAMRYAYAGENMVFENCYFKENGGEWVFHIDGKSSGVTESNIIFKNCTFDGKRVAIGVVTSVRLENCKFVNGSYFNSYSKTDCIGCDFNTSIRPLDKLHTYTNCTYKGESLTVDNLKFYAGYPGVVKIDDAPAFAKPSSSEDLVDVISYGAEVMELYAGEYVMPGNVSGKTLSFKGTGNVEDVQVTVVGTGGENCDYGLQNAKVTFDGITLNTNNSTYTGYAYCKADFKNCVINGTYTLYDNSSFENCVFNVSGDVYNLWTWGAPVAKFNGCTFNSDGKAVLLYGTADTKLTIENSVFNDKGGLDEKKAAIEIGNDYNKSYELIVNKTTVNGYEINDKGINTGTTLWANKNSMGQDKLNVVVDGVDVY